LRFQDDYVRGTDSLRRLWRSLLRRLECLGIWRRRTAEEPDVVLLRNAEFQIMLTELRYPPIQHLYVRRARRTPISWIAGTDTGQMGDPRGVGNPCPSAFRDREEPTQNDLELRVQRVAGAPQ
jgi:hypothetical protein